MMVGGRTEIHGLTQAALLLDSHAALHVDVVVKSVEIRQAPALLQLLVTATTADAMDWTLKRDMKLRHLARIACETDVLLDVVIPLLKANSSSAIGGRLLMRYGWSLRHLGRKVDGLTGPFYSSVAVKLSNFMRRHAGHLDHGDKGVVWLVDNLTSIEESLLELKQTVVIIPVEEGGGAAAEEDNDDEADGGDDEEDEADGGGDDDIN